MLAPPHPEGLASQPQGNPGFATDPGADPGFPRRGRRYRPRRGVQPIICRKFPENCMK